MHRSRDLVSPVRGIFFIPFCIYFVEAFSKEGSLINMKSYWAPIKSNILLFLTYLVFTNSFTFKAYSYLRPVPYNHIVSLCLLRAELIMNAFSQC